MHWDQRGAGKSCSSDVPDESLRRDQYVADTLELVAWLRSRFGVEKIYLLGHSWGSFLGVMAVQRQPDLFHAYIGLGQVVDMRRGEEISYRWVVERAKAEGNDQALKQLREIRPPYRSLDDLMLHRSWLGHYGGDYYGGGYVLELVRALLTSSEYTLMEALSYYGCLLNCLEHGWSDLEGIDFIRSVERLDVPVYFFTGRHDYNTPFELVEEWAQVLTAPHVEIVWFDDSAHWASIEEPERFQDELIDRVLAAGVANTRGR